MSAKDEYSDQPLHSSIFPRDRHFWGKNDGHRWKKWINIDRWLRSKVGRHWDEVHSEWLNLKKPGCIERVYEDLSDYYVEHNCTMADGQIYDSKGEPLTYWKGFVVIDGILQEVKQDNPKYRPKLDEHRRWNYGVIWLGEKIYANIKNIWYELKVEEIVWKWDDPYNLSKHDIFLDKWISAYQIKKKYDSEANLRELLYSKANLYCVEKHQLNKQQIKKLDLRNIKGHFDE